MTPDELRPILAEYRKRVQPAWSKATAHPDHDAADGSPVGQCGVTSAWLQQRLREDHGVETLYCEGAVWINQSWTDQHCWLEGVGPSRAILDLTGSQLGLTEVVCDRYLDLWERDKVLYSCDQHRTPAVPTEVRPRLALLEAALS